MFTPDLLPTCVNIDFLESDCAHMIKVVYISVYRFYCNVLFVCKCVCPFIHGILRMKNSDFVPGGACRSGSTFCKRKGPFTRKVTVTSEFSFVSMVMQTQTQTEHGSKPDSLHLHHH